MSKEDSGIVFNIPDSIKEMEREMIEEDKKVEEKNLQTIKDRNQKARLIIQKFSTPIEIEVDGIIFTLKPISVSTWDMIEGNKEEPSAQSIVVRNCLTSPKLSDEEFNLLPAGIKYKLFMFLLQDFFLIAGRTVKKNPDTS